MFIFASSTNHFGINTDIFETNVLNLSVVLFVLVYYGRIVLSDLINAHKTLVVKSLQEVENKLAQAESNLAYAKSNFETSKVKAIEIRNQAVLLSSQAKSNLLLDVENDIKRLKSVSLALIRIEEDKSVNEMCNMLMDSAIRNSVEVVAKRLNVNLHKKIISRNTDKLSVRFTSNR